MAYKLSLVTVLFVLLEHRKEEKPLSCCKKLLILFHVYDEIAVFTLIFTLLCIMFNYCVPSFENKFVGLPLFNEI